MVTVLVPEPGPVSEAYQSALNYFEVARETVGENLAGSWNAPQVADNDYRLLMPQSREPVYLRFIGVPDQGNYEPLKTEGWNAIEILVQDPDAVAETLRASPHFKVVGEPAFLTERKQIKAMQAIGPANELLYLTRIKSQESSGFGLMPAVSEVDRVFIMVLAARDRTALDTFYGDTFGMAVAGPFDYRVSVLSRAWSLPEETLYPLTLVQLSPRFVLELDDYPDEAQTRSVTSEGLPGGIVMVTFVVDDLAPFRDHWLAEPVALPQAPYNGRRAVTLVGPAGEYIELVEERAAP
ncbi:MAG: VOC family protein, partial [Pseudomonadota bacterium]